MKLTVVVPTLNINRDGVSASVAGLTNAMMDLPICLETVSLGEVFGLNLPVNKIHKLPLYQIPLIRLQYNILFRKYLRQHLDEFKPGVVHIHSIWNPVSWDAAHIARSKNIPYLISIRGALSQWALSYKSLKKKAMWKAMQERLLETASVLHATSIEEANDIRKTGITVPVAIIPNAVDLPDLNQRNDPFPNKEKYTALFLSRIHPVKGLITLVEAWARVRPENWKLLIAGQDEIGHKADVEKVISVNGLKDSVHFIGSVTSTEKWSVYGESDLFILPSLSENFGIVIAEALASGLPVITTNKTPWGKIAERQCGWIVEPEPQSLAEAIRQATLLSDEERRTMGRRARTLIENEYSWNKSASQMMLVYNWILGKEKKPDFVI